MAVYCSTPATLRLEQTNTAGAVTATLDLMDQANGYRVDGLEVQFPTVREVVAALPTRDGDYDTTRLFGPRVVTVTGSVIPVAGKSREASVSALAAWCAPALRPRLVYAVDPGSPPVTIGLRGSQFSAPFNDQYYSSFSVSWVAPNPVAFNLAAQRLISINPQTQGAATNYGTYKSWPLLNIYGPCGGIVITWVSPPGGVISLGYTIASGHYVQVDGFNQTVKLDGTGQSLFSSLDFTATRWAALELGTTTIAFSPATSSAGARLEVAWYDAYI